MKHGKHYVDAAKQVDFSKLYDMNEALELALSLIHISSMAVTLSGRVTVCKL